MHHKEDRSMSGVSLETIVIPGTSLAPSRVALGTWAIGGWMWGGSDDRESIRTIHRALDLGINIIDTAPVYGFGHAEEVVGKALAERGGRENVIIGTKVGLDWRDGQPFRNGSRTRIQREIEDSLRRLRSDVIDIYQVHWPDPKTPIEETAGVLAELYRAGTIRAIGVSNFSPAQMDSFRAAAPLHAAQPPHNLFEREAEMSFPIAVSIGSQRLPTDRSAAGCLLAASRPRQGSTATICGGRIRSSRRRASSNIFARWRGSTRLPRRTTASAFLSSRYAGCSTGSRSA
jgi:aryl-alcohol dehydrogenase-like predicted oxidoreductase